MKVAPHRGACPTCADRVPPRAMPSLSYAAALIVFLCVQGCESPRLARIREHADVYHALDKFSRKLVNDGLFDFGFSPEVVYMSMGKPDRVMNADTPNGPTETWVYKNFLYGNLSANSTFSPGSGLISMRPSRSGPSSSGAGSVAGTGGGGGAPQSTVLDMGDAPRATLFLEFRDGRVVAAHLDL